MGIMTLGAGFGPDGIPAMCFFEGSLLAVMARQTELRISIVQEIRLIGTVRNMAYHASARLKGFVHHFLFERLLRMALIAEVCPFGLEQVICLGCMGIVAERALPVFQRSMDMGLGQAELLFAVAGVTNLIADFLENELRDNTVTKVAAFAFLFLRHRMDIFHRQVFLLEFGMAGKTVLLRKCLSFDRGPA